MTTVVEPMHLWKCDGGSLWVFAPTLDEAKRLLVAEGYTREYLVEQIPDDEQFTMMFDEIPDGYTSDCRCTMRDRADKSACECGYGNSVTLTAAEWCRTPDVLGTRVFEEFEA
ncbi:MAG: hypothetical protein ACYDGM_11590 [Vulcanimicrobiaceae bacterium]